MNKTSKTKTMKTRFFAMAVLFGASFLFAGCSISGIGLQTSQPDNKGGVYKSVDGGETFEQKIKINETSSLANSTISTMTFDPADNNILYLGTVSGLYKSTNAGEKWDKVESNLKSVKDIVIHPYDSKIMYIPAKVGGTGKIMKTVDGGDNWEEVFTQRTPEGAIFSIAIDYSNPETLYAGDSSGGIYRTDDGGRTWKTLLWHKSGIKSIKLDSVNPDKIYFVSSKSKALRTDDGGENFIQLNELKGLIYNLLPHPYLENVVYVSDKKGLHRSENGGMDLKQIITLVHPKNINSRGIVVSPQDENIIYFASGKAIYKSVNGGETWRPIQFTIPRIVQMMLIDPENADILYLGTKAVQQQGGGMKLFPF